MTKVEFVKRACEKVDMTQKDMMAALEAIEETMLEDIFAEEESVRLKIGTFSGYTKTTSDRKGRNPATGEIIKIKGKTVKGYPKFKPSKAAKE